ncbi:MAG: hypothetical protein HOG20_04150 [Candidatus Marinimicrobia bacterium]|jgi:DMSO reductase family type II enzyme chaperone|nr:hypothetical protein [Candidatus Neomarinimicrobiota bacterium]MBT3692396.1 hypothetical protein [Candidatus Neomarinimicrobiota bacterium]MBT3732385.1 hypothetical protein [Candidatus Neomarinimicrobiota bacterium]MBT4990166.1 hypothetical protein [Candidatus Neomarinimicrobiota bacterium]MBT5355143.1 hypothetical protein [Candidatus Neomarinimicrobiota bacterium]
MKDSLDIQLNSQLLARSAAYALFSNLVSSPHEGHILFKDIQTVILVIQKDLPFQIDFDSMTQETKAISKKEWQKLVRSYSGLFEVGNDGPPIPIRESAHPSLTFKREEVTRYYEYFGYEINENSQWESDHLAIELEFLHFLCQGEMTSGDALSFQLAQKDFIERHINLWVSSIIYRLKKQIAHPYWSSIFTTLDDFLQLDLKWLNTNLDEVKEAI